MKIKTEEQLGEFIETWEELSQKAADIATAILKLEGKTKAVVTDDEIRIEYGDIYAEYEEYMGCNQYDSHTVKIPLSYFFDEKFLEDAQVKIDKAKAEEAKRKRDLAAKQEAKRLEADRAKYLKLKAQFG